MEKYSTIIINLLFKNIFIVGDCMDIFNVKLDIPYPKIIVNKKDKNLAYRIMDSYAGIISELTQITQYSFQSFYLNKYVDLSKILESIAMVEMEHLKILGILIDKLGLIPYYATYNNNTAIPWNSDYVNFTTDYRSMLVYNIDSEKETIKAYNKIISSTDDENIIAIFKRIILDEERHIQIFSELLKNYDEDEK